MVRSGTSVSEIIARINNSEADFRLYGEDVHSLEKDGVPAIVIEAMFARNAGHRLTLGDVTNRDSTDGSGTAGDTLGTPRHSQSPQPITSGRLKNAVFYPDEARARSSEGGSGIREAIIVPESTPVRLRLTRNLSSTNERTNDTVHFEVLEDVNIRNRIGNFVIIKRGATALGTITDANPKRRMGRGGKVEVTIDSVNLVDGDRIALSAPPKQGDHHGHVGLMVGLMVPTAFVEFPATPFWLFMHGKDSTIKDGFDMTAYTDGVADLDSSLFERRE